VKIIHIITGLGDGGAEHILYKICRYDHLNEHIVISLKRFGKYFKLLNKLDVKVYSLNINIFSIFQFFKLIKILRLLKPDLVQTWLVHGDFVGSIAAKLAGIQNIVWNVRYSNLERKNTKFTTFVLVKILAKLSHIIPKSVIVVSKSTKFFCINFGYNKKKLCLISNGYDLNILKPLSNQKLYFQKKLKIKKNVPIIGLVARYHPVKDHFNLLQALSIMKSKNINFYCVLVGSNINNSNVKLISEIKRLKLSNFIKLIETNNNIVQVMNGLNIKILCSKREGFPNVVAEAMACGTPCIVTDVGDAALIVGKTGWIIPPNNPIKLAEAINKAINEMITKNWSKRCNQSRIRIEKKFDISKMIASYNKEWIKVYKK
jgi:glycosyltransferase involved in cell wall biosynthesis